MTDLDALKEDLAYLRERGDLAAALTATTAELHRLIEEVERLRGVNADLRLMVDGLETAAHEERAAVVAWLRGRQEASEWALTAAGYEHAAYAIERGEHRREEEP